MALGFFKPEFNGYRRIGTYIRMVPDAPSPALLKTEVRLQLPPGWSRFISLEESWRAAKDSPARRTKTP